MLQKEVANLFLIDYLCALEFKLNPERWVSGLNQRFAKPPYGVNLYREFKSPPLRRIKNGSGTSHFHFW